MMKIDYSFGIIPIFKTKYGICEFLLINQKTNNGSFWGFPKGHAELGESELESAKRELWEEVGIKNIEIVGNKIYTINYSFLDGNILVKKTVKYRPAIVKTKKVIIQNIELNGYKWANLENSIKLLTHKNIKEILNKIAKDMIG